MLAKYQRCVSEAAWRRRCGVCSPDSFLLCLMRSRRVLPPEGHAAVLGQAKDSLERWLQLALVRMLAPRLVSDVNFVVKPTLELQNTSVQYFSDAPCTEKLLMSCCPMLSSSTMGYDGLRCSLCRSVTIR